MRTATTRRARPIWLHDALAGLLVLGAGIVCLWVAHQTDWYPRAEHAVRLSIGATALVTATRRVWPRATFWVTVIGFPILYDAPIDLEITVLPIAIAGYGVTRAGRMRLPLALAIVAGSTAVLFRYGNEYLYWLSNPGDLLAHWSFYLVQLYDQPVNYSDLALCLVITLFATFLGWTTRRMDLQRLELDARRASLERQNAELERLRLVEAREAVGAERTRIARELHDVIAHHVSAIVVRASATARVTPDDAHALRETVEWVADEGRHALDDMREIVRVLRTDEETPYAPTVDITGVDAAVETARAAGLEVEFDRDGEVPLLSPTASSALTRVAQEALTNVLLHSRAASATVRVSAEPSGVRLTVRDPGPPVASDAGADRDREGNGLRNMTERAAACRGTLVAGPADEGWEVRAWIPTSPPS